LASRYIKERSHQYQSSHPIWSNFIWTVCTPRTGSCAVH